MATRPSRSSCGGGASRSSASIHRRTRRARRIRKSWPRPSRGPAHPPLPLPRDRPDACPASSISSSRVIYHAGQIVVPYPGGPAPARAPTCARCRGPLRVRRDDSFTSRPASARPSSRSGSSRVRRSRSWLYDRRDGGSRHLERGSRPVRGRRGARGGGCLGPRARRGRDLRRRRDDRHRRPRRARVGRGRGGRRAAGAGARRRVHRAHGERRTSRPSTSSSSASARRPRSNDVAARRPHRRDRSRPRRRSARRASGGRAAATASPRSGSGSSARRTSGGRGERSTATTTAVSSARCSTALRRSFRARPIFLPVRRRTTPCSSRAPICSPRRSRGSSSRSSSPRSARRATRARERLEAFAYRYREGTPPAERFLVHRTVFPHDFLADFGFRTLRSSGRIELARLDLGGLQPVEEGAREKVLSVVRRRSSRRPHPLHPAADRFSPTLGRRSSSRATRRRRAPRSGSR